ncbi:MAG TPA: hypothetical protein VKT81_01925 [Bryobacteraceae bacterium]|nr:hypothetical protein [Bryobacteraceae bacterium]
MTGQIAFARTLRALDADSFRFPKLGLFFAIAILAAWTWWFLTPSVSNFGGHAEGTLTWYGPHQVAIAVFPEAPEIDMGQAVQLHTEGRVLAARVEHVGFLAHDVRFIMLHVYSTLYPPLPQDALIDVETNRISPATRILSSFR